MASTSFNIDQAKSFVSKQFDESCIPAISKYIEIPNVSPAYDPQWKTNGLQEQAVDHIVNWVKGQNVPGLTLEVVTLPERTPVIFMTLEGKGSDQTVLLYGHLDKQPPLTESWEPGLHPYKPVIRDGKLYGRGGADDGYATFSAITAIKALLEQGVAHPRCVIIVEAREESGSQDLPAYVDHLKDRIGVPSLIVCLDSGCGNYEQFWMTTSLRGCVMGALNVKILKEGVHSGHASGIVPSSFRIIRQLLDRIEDASTGRVLLPELNKEIPAFRIQQQKEAAAILGESIHKEMPWVEGAHAMGHDELELLLNRTWRPTVSYTGIDGVPTVAAGGNVLRTETTLKISVRTPPHVSAKEAGEALKRVLEKDAPYGAKVTFDVLAAMSGWASPALAPWLEKTISETGVKVFGKKEAYLGEGGSIPFMGMLGEKFPQAQFVITGVLGPSSNAHGPNEFLHIEMTKNVTATVAAILAQTVFQK